MKSLLIIFGILVASSTSFADCRKKVNHQQTRVIIVKKTPAVKRKVWIPGHWVKIPRGRVWVTGHWRKV